MSNPYAAYQKTNRAVMTPRAIEASVLAKAAVKLDAAQKGFDDPALLDDALAFNKMLWTLLVSDATEPTNPLATEIKNNIINLGNFVFNRTIEIMADPQPEKLNVLISINRNLAAGLS